MSFPDRSPTTTKFRAVQGGVIDVRNVDFRQRRTLCFLDCLEGKGGTGGRPGFGGQRATIHGNRIAGRNALISRNRSPVRFSYRMQTGYLDTIIKIELVIVPQMNMSLLRQQRKTA
jgi:hypothetical protein